MTQLTRTLNVICLATFLLNTLSIQSMEPQKTGAPCSEEKQHDESKCSNPDDHTKNHPCGGQANQLVLVEQVGPLKIYYHPSVNEEDRLLLPEETRKRLEKLERKHAALLTALRPVQQVMNNQPPRTIREIIDDWNIDNTDNPIDPLAWANKPNPFG